MSTATIHIPHEHLGAVRESLQARRHEIASDGGLVGAHLREIDAVLEQIDAGSRDAAQPVTGPHAVLWDAAYDALCLAAERFTADCNDLWRGGTDPAGLRAELEALRARIDLLEGLGPPPAPQL